MVDMITYNVNGIRAAIKHGFVDWLAKNNFDIVCLQEIKAMEDQVDLSIFKELGYTCYWFPAEKKGYSGVATLTKIKPDNVEYGLGIPEYDKEGRCIKIDIGDVTLLNMYFPSGSSGDHRQAIKMRFLGDFIPYIRKILKKKQLLISGDVNICHQPIDIHNPVSNANSSGFLPEERTWFTSLLNEGFFDTFRKFHNEPDQYTWWSYRAGARQRNLGWRIDYHIASEALKNRILDCQILSEAKHSDHCPVYLKINL